MAKKIEKSSNVEEVKYTEKKWDSVSKKLKVAIIVALVLSIFILALQLYWEIHKTIEIAPIDESEYQRISMIVDNMDWTIAKNDFSQLRKTIDSTLNGNGYTNSSDGIISLILIGNNYSLSGNFSYDSGYIDGFINGIYARLFFSESVLRKGRTLTIFIDGNKLVFYEND